MSQAQLRESPRSATDEEIENGRHRLSTDEESPFEREKLIRESTAPSIQHGETKRINVSRIRTIFSDMVPREIKTTRTVAALLLGENSKAEHYLFTVGVKNQTATSILWMMWYIGAILGLFTVGRALPLYFVWGSLLMLPLPIVTVILLSVDLVEEICGSIDVYIIWILQFALFVDGIYYCHVDLRVVFWCCYLPTMIVSGLVDAYPAKFRPLFGKLFFSAMLVILLVWNCFLVFKWEVFGDPTKLTNVSFALHHVSDMLTLLVFYARHLYCSMKRPDYYAMIKADVKTGRQECGRGTFKGSTRGDSPGRKKEIC